jgi:hypothetical protein
MEFRNTSHQVARGSMPDAEAFNRMYLIKNVRKLRATYQIRLLTYRALERGTKLILRVPAHCEFDRTLVELVGKSKNAIVRENY